MDSVIQVYVDEINTIMDRVARGSYRYSDIATLKNHIDGYNRRVKWLKAKRRPGNFPEVKYEDFGMRYQEDAIYLKFIKKK